ncbi:hypothetical protein AYI70_g416 [Smittium culicis]|uniref:Uncharacterized protein n=1 Tax=Smittium culicis TaxID=133412 RepID=A0A1R1YGU0_9FUNG|nr:hypothetical protein AYI70_g416 [Smittium culicis]
MNNPSLVSAVAILEADFGPNNGGLKEFVVTHSQAAVLMLFTMESNTTGSLSSAKENYDPEDNIPIEYGYIQNQTRLDSSDLDIILISLTLAKVNPLKIINKKPNVSISNEYKFIFNFNCVNEIKNEVIKSQSRYKLNMAHFTLHKNSRSKSFAMNRDTNDTNMDVDNVNINDFNRNTTKHKDLEGSINSIEIAKPDDGISSLTSMSSINNGQIDLTTKTLNNEMSNSGGNNSHTDDSVDKKVNSQILHEQLYKIDAAIVRLLKYHRNMKHDDLFSDLKMILKFPFSVSNFFSLYTMVLNLAFLRIKLL